MTKPTKRHVRTAKTQIIRAVSPEPSLLAHTSSESRGTFKQKAKSLAPLNGWACAVEICHDGMLEDTNSLDGAHMENMSLCSYKDVNSIKRDKMASSSWSNLHVSLRCWLLFTRKLNAM